MEMVYFHLSRGTKVPLMDDFYFVFSLVRFFVSLNLPFYTVSSLKIFYQVMTEDFQVA